MLFIKQHWKVILQIAVLTVCVSLVGTCAVFVIAPPSQVIEGGLTRLLWKVFLFLMAVFILVFLASLVRVAQRLVDKHLFCVANLPPIPDWKRHAATYGLVFILSGVLIIVIRNV